LDDQTLKFYRENAVEVFQGYDAARGGIVNYLTLSFPPGAKLLDIGAGSGRDLLKLLQLGYDAYGVDPCNELIDVATATYPELGPRLAQGSLPKLNAPFGGEFDGIVCSAVLMHLAEEQLFDSVFAIRSALKSYGRLLLSVPLSRPGLDQERRDAHGRLFVLYPPDQLHLIFERVGFQQIARWTNDDALGRPGYTWITLLFQLTTAQSSRPIDQIEGILNRDRKVATYKLALFRALADIAMTSFHRARWRNDGTVEIPIEDIVERWIYYFWPIFASSTFTPQIRGELPNCKKPIAFRHDLETLIEHYRNLGGLSAFYQNFRSSAVGRDISPVLKALSAKVARTIIEGPVTYAGGSLETGRVFAYDKQNRKVVLSSGIWHELSLMGHWIKDAVLLRWAELSSEISKKQLTPAQIIDLLLTGPTVERDVCFVRSVYSDLPNKRCVWTDSSLEGVFAVDHVIPFSLWKNNDLWNLLPVAPKVNLSKRDRLPTRRVMEIRRDAIIYFWQQLRAANTPRFDYEACRIMGAHEMPSRNWEPRMFAYLVDAVEVTALQRGCERWEP
jgi:SAM-dependent methyltransferase